MDNRQFDAIVRHLGCQTRPTRRAALAALGTFVVARLTLVDDDVAGKRRKRRRRKKPKKQAQTTCFGAVGCEYVDGSHDYDDCNFAGSSLFKDGVGFGSSYRRANFNGADLSGADLSGSKFLRADLRNANFREANLDGSVMDESCLFDADLTDVFYRGPFLATAYLCRTITPDGALNNRDCETAPPCCYA